MPWCWHRPRACSVCMGSAATGNTRNCCTNCWTQMAPAYGEDWWFETVYSFAACETGRLDLAWTLIERSLAKNPRHGHAAHFRTHVMYERGEGAEAIDYLVGWMRGMDKRNVVHCHLSWGVALAALAAGRHE